MIDTFKNNWAHKHCKRRFALMFRQQYCPHGWLSSEIPGPLAIPTKKSSGPQGKLMSSTAKPWTPLSCNSKYMISDESLRHLQRI